MNAHISVWKGFTQKNTGKLKFCYFHCNKSFQNFHSASIPIFLEDIVITTSLPTYDTTQMATINVRFFFFKLLEDQSIVSFTIALLGKGYTLQIYHSHGLIIK